jgi:hypothetical protein
VLVDWVGLYADTSSNVVIEVLLPRFLLVLGLCFLAANCRLLFHYVQFMQRRPSSLLTWRNQTPPLYGLLLSLGVVLGILLFYELALQRRALGSVFGEGMMFLYYAYLLPLNQRIRRGFYKDGIWSDKEFIPYRKIGGMSWREDKDIALVVGYRARPIARRLIVPKKHYAEARRVLRDKISAHDIHFTGKRLDLGTYDARNVI